MGTKQLYIIKSCERILNMYCNSITPLSELGGGGGAQPQKYSYASCLAKF